MTAQRHDLLGAPGPDAAIVKEATESLAHHCVVLDAHLSGRRFLVGDRLSVADLAVAVTLPYAEAAKLPIAPFTSILRWHARLNELPAWREPFAAMPAA